MKYTKVAIFLAFSIFCLFGGIQGIIVNLNGTLEYHSIHLFKFVLSVITAVISVCIMFIWIVVGMETFQRAKEQK